MKSIRGSANMHVNKHQIAMRLSMRRHDRKHMASLRTGTQTCIQPLMLTVRNAKHGDIALRRHENTPSLASIPQPVMSPVHITHAEHVCGLGFARPLPGLRPYTSHLWETLLRCGEPPSPQGYSAASRSPACIMCSFDSRRSAAICACGFPRIDSLSMHPWHAQMACHG